MYRHLRIREALRHRTAALDPAVYALGCAVWEVEPSRQSHSQCQAELPGLVEAEWHGQSNSPDFLMARRHLQICSNCAKIYLDLTDLAAKGAAAGSARASPIPVPNLSFLETDDA